MPKRTEDLRIRVSLKEKRLIKAAAAKKGLPVATWLRSAVLALALTACSRAPLDDLAHPVAAADAGVDALEVASCSRCAHCDESSGTFPCTFSDGDPVCAASSFTCKGCCGWMGD